MNRYFFTGAPGSRWSGVAQIIEHVGKFDTSDRNESRMYSHDEFSGHKGMYFGNSMECDAVLVGETLDHYFESKENRLIKSHDWAYKLNDVHQFCKQNNDKMIVVYRYTLNCFDWWLKAGGFNISYPNYSWYQNEEKMFLEITRQNKAILDFVNSHPEMNLVTFNNEWLERHFGKFDGDLALYDDVSVAIL